MRKGKIIPNGVVLEKHEMETVVFLTELGYDIELILPSNIPNVRMPDFKMKNLKWEMKSPKGKSHSTLEHAFQTAVKQSENVIFDLRRIDLPDVKSCMILKKIMDTSKRAKRMGIITKGKRLLWYPVDIDKKF